MTKTSDTETESPSERTERVLRSASKQREGHRWIGGMISVEARRELDFLRDHWAARSNMEIVQAALGYLAECTREGYVVRETPGLESLP